MLADVNTWGTILPPSLMVVTQGGRDYLVFLTQDFVDNKWYQQKTEIVDKLRRWIFWFLQQECLANMRLIMNFPRQTTLRH